jgi:hypothetical protein
MSLFFALLQVTWPTYINYGLISWQKTARDPTHKGTYLRDNLKSIANSEQCLTESSTIVR